MLTRNLESPQKPASDMSERRVSVPLVFILGDQNAEVYMPNSVSAVTQILKSKPRIKIEGGGTTHIDLVVIILPALAGGTQDPCTKNLACAIIRVVQEQH